MEIIPIASEMLYLCTEKQLQAGLIEFTCIPAVYVIVE